MDDTKREELEKACKKEKDHKVRTRMVAIRMVRVRNMSVEETAIILVHCPTWIRDRLRTHLGDSQIYCHFIYAFLRTCHAYCKRFDCHLGVFSFRYVAPGSKQITRSWFLWT